MKKNWDVLLKGRWEWGWSRSIAGKRDRKFRYFVQGKVSQVVSKRNAWRRGKYGDEDKL